MPCLFGASAEQLACGDCEYFGEKDNEKRIVERCIFYDDGTSHSRCFVNCRQKACKSFKLKND